MIRVMGAPLKDFGASPTQTRAVHTEGLGPVQPLQP